MTLVEQRDEVVPLIDACDALDVSRASFYRARHPHAPSQNVRQRAPNPRRLDEVERRRLLDTMHLPEFADQPPTEVYASLLGRGIYLASIRTMYRVLAEAGETGERRNQRAPHAYARPSLTATAPNQVWTWDITKLATTQKGGFLMAYVIIDLFSRYVVGWMLATKECKHLAAQLFAETIARHGIEPGLQVHADRGSAMKSDTLAQLLPFQREDFRGILEAMAGLPVTIRLLDPPLHEFLPSLEQLLVETTTLRLTKGENDPAYREKMRVLGRVQALHEENPMLGLRVCRLGILYPEIYAMQVRAIFEAACDLRARGIDVRPDVMIPGVGTFEEMRVTNDATRAVADEVIARRGVAVPYRVGTMIELPRACVVAGDLAQLAQFFSFGTNDLTQTVYGYSRDDAEASFIPRYLEEKILKVDPFQVLDRTGVGELMRMGVERGRAQRPELKIGICGEHGGEPSSVAFCDELGLDYVSCSPYRVPIARLAAAQSALATSA